MSNWSSRRPWRCLPALLVAPLPALALTAMIGGCGGTEQAETEAPASVAPAPATTTMEPASSAVETTNTEVPPAETVTTPPVEPVETPSGEPVVTPTIKPTLGTPAETAPADTPKVIDEPAQPTPSDEAASPEESSEPKDEATKTGDEPKSSG